MKILDKDENLINKNYILKLKTDRVARKMRWLLKPVITDQIKEHNNYFFNKSFCPLFRAAVGI